MTPPNRAVPSAADVASWTDEERTSVARALDAWQRDSIMAGRPMRQRHVMLAITIVGALVLVPWIAYLSVTLPEHHRTGMWDVAWVGFDVILLVMVAASAWSMWRRRMVTIAFLAASAITLMLDAWFDIVLSWGSKEARSSVITGLFIEVPVALLFIATIMRILRRSGEMVARLRGVEPPRHALAVPMPMAPTDGPSTTGAVS